MVIERKGYKGAILAQINGVTVKVFKTWATTDNEHIIEIKFKSKKTKEKKVIVKTYKTTEDRVSLLACCEAIIKYWKPYDPSKHHLVITTGHVHEISK